MLGEEAELGERGFWVRKTEPYLEVWVVVRRLVRRLRNYWRDQINTRCVDADEGAGGSALHRYLDVLCPS